MVSRTGLNATTKIIALIGDPVAHSLTPVIQNAALEAMKVNVVNVACQVRADGLKDAVAGARVMGFLGLMVTIPHKEAAVRLADRVDPSAQLTGSANLLVFRENDGVCAYSTDGYAALRSLSEIGFDPAGKTITLVGAGGAGRALALHLAQAKAKRLYIANRTQERAQSLTYAINLLFPETEVIALSLSEKNLEIALGFSDLLINATSVGMHPHSEDSPVPSHLLRPPLVIFDIVYNPVWTTLLKEARGRGCRVLDGVPMLVYTNEKALEHCLGVSVPEAIVRLMMETCYRALGEGATGD
ncbi:MAG: shikimate dehydrogenase [Armatimonadetes bacterium]|nr:shikimate dehydrogenase [Armatimonadota bacterium]MDW8121502.1 shikimate dehydrogenase [Armatimonadota bacterium]